jgi:tetratricopeptide (TPR) repeat protein
MSEHPRIEELRRRVQADPASIAFAALAEEYRRASRYEEAIETCRTGLQRHPSYLSARVTLGRALIEIGDYDAARVELETVLKAAPENLAAIRGLGEIHQRKGELVEALDQYKSALELSQHDPELQETVQRISQAVTVEPAAPERRGPLPLASASPAADIGDWKLPPPAPAREPATLQPVIEAPAPPVSPALDRLESLLAAIQSRRAALGGVAAPAR